MKWNTAIRAEQDARARAAFLAHYEQEGACAMWERMFERVGTPHLAREPVKA